MSSNYPWRAEQLTNNADEQGYDEERDDYIILNALMTNYAYGTFLFRPFAA
jgi:hypothetical protein